MTRIFIHAVDDTTDLLSALAAVTLAFTDPSAFDQDRQVFAKHDPGDWPGRIAEEVEARPEPDPFLPCPDRGTHARLTDCWMCWADVHRGAAVETDVLQGSWDSSLAQLIDGEDTR